MAGLTQRRRNPVASSMDNYDDGPEVGRQGDPLSSSYSINSSTSPPQEPAQQDSDFQADDDGFTEEEMSTRKVKLTLMEEVLLLGIKDEQGYLSFWNDNISYVLRGCILMELSLRHRIQCMKEYAGRHHRKPFYDRLLEVVDERPTDEVLLDEALKVFKADQKGISPNSSGRSITGSTPNATPKPAQRHSLTDWVDLLSGETWNIMKMSYQLKQVRERLAKGLVDKGVLRTEKKNFLVFEMATHPVADPSIKMEVVMRVVNCLLGRGPTPSRRTIALCCAAYAANVLENALTSASVSGGMQLSYSQKDTCFAKCEEFLVEWSGMQAFDAAAKNEAQPSSVVGPPSNGMNKEKERIGWTDVMSGVVGVYLKMDSML